MTEIDYRALAMRMRATHELVAARENGQRLAEGGVRLAEVLDLLTSDQGAPLEQMLLSEAEAAVDETNRKLADAGASSMNDATFLQGRREDEFLPSDPFRKQLASFFNDYLVGFVAPSVTPSLVPQAVIEALADAAGPGGILTDQIALEKLGPTGVAVLQRCRTLLAQKKPASDRPDTKLEDVGVIAAERLMRSRERPDPLARMAVLNELSRAMGGPNKLKGWKMAAVQHLFPSTEGLFRAFKNNGLSPGRVVVGGKGYSTDAETFVKLQAQGYHVHHMGRAVVHGGQGAEDIVKMMARDELRMLFAGIDPTKETRRQFILLDEGGKLIQLLHEEFPQYAHLCVAVEQTDRGIQLIEDMEKRGIKLKCPVVNMARCDAKKIWESPMIGESCVYNVERDLEEIDVEVNPKVASIIGYGAVGKATADRLRARGYTVYVYDTDPKKMEQAEKDGCLAKDRDTVLKNAHLLYGCTGRGAITEDDYELLPDGAVLANAASGNHELGNAQFVRDVEVEHGHARGQFRGTSIDLGEAHSPMRHGVVRTKSGKELLFMRSGYVCNMGRDIPPEVVQLIRGLLLASVLQAVDETESKLIDVNPDAQAFLIDRINKVLAEYGTSLLDPDFRKLFS